MPPTRLPAKGRIEVIRYVRSNRRVDLFGKRITVAEDQTHQYVTAIITVRAKKVIVVILDGEIIHDGDFSLARTLRQPERRPGGTAPPPPERCPDRSPTSSRAERCPGG